MHNHNDKNDSSMMWMMIVCCALPIIILFALGSGISSGGYFWPILIVTLTTGICWIMMRRGHGTRGDDPAKSESMAHEEKDKNHGCH